MGTTVKVKKVKSAFDLKMAYFGLPIALIVLALIWTMQTPEGLSYTGKMALGIFAFALILWVSNGIPNYVTSLIVLVLLPVTGAWTQAEVLGVFGYDVIWLMIAAFVIASGMEKSGLARRLALFLITKLGKSTNSVLVVLMLVNFLISFVVPSTTARAAMLLPIVMMIIEIFEVNNESKSDRNFGKLLALQGIQANNFSTAAIVTATSSQILAISFIKDLTGVDVSWMDWFIAAAPITLLTLVASFFIGKLMFPISNRTASKEKMTALQNEYKSLGGMNSTEIKALIIFAITITLWAIDSLQVSLFGFQLSLVVVAIVSAILFFLPHIGILEWKEAKISWNLLVFSCGAYAGGLALDSSGVASWALNRIFGSLKLESLGFFGLYAVVIFIASFSHFVFTSKTVRTIILIPAIIAIAKTAGVNPVALALPASFMIADTVTLPPHSKVNLIYYGTGNFTVLEQMTYGIAVLLAKWGIMVVASFTWFKIIRMV
ncbi:SLC13 family permease [Clostridium hydrogeniformans]|uniref:SLC13 family permease n=1 Tax=Clostridium hydrogeniformans TaxID=349933 RepID=UPI0004831176|nr:DASS family sodium-coupled anion symporter [Clostridium hydrogeniformans]